MTYIHIIGYFYSVLETNMQMAGIQDKNQKVNDNIAYYDNIAAGYDEILDKDEKNKTIRTKVAATFTSLIEKGTIIDFGGGTGRDFEWMVSRKYHVLFCEPSQSMREIAVQRCSKEFSNSDISFLNDEQVNFRNWNDEFPFKEKMDGLLANFAVINCIPGIELLFEKFSLVLKPGGIVVLLMLDNSLSKRLQSNLKGSMKSLFSGETVSYSIGYNNKQQLVYLHTDKQLKKAMARYFEIARYERLTGTGFSLIQLVKK